MKNRGKKSCVTKVVFLTFMVHLCAAMGNSGAAYLEVGFYEKSCPSGEAIVRKVVEEAVGLNPGIAASLLRLSFHDCFVRGCDGSVLLDSTPDFASEKVPLVSTRMRGFQVIDAAKSQLEAACPKTVSCADLLQFAARDSSVLSGGLNYQVPAGRRDGRTSLPAEAAQNVPGPAFNATQLVQIFAQKGLSLDDMVVLSGSHSIGVSTCSAFGPRLYNFSTLQIEDPTLPPVLAKNLKNTCPSSVLVLPINTSLTVSLDSTPRILDNKYFVELEQSEGILGSDQTLMSNELTAKLVRKYAKNGKLWSLKFAKAMVRMAAMEVLTGEQGEIRRNCRIVN